MQAGEFFIQFFNSRGGLSEKDSGECNVLCPFPHDKGYETNPSAHVNLKRYVYHCKTCQAEGRFNDGGLSEIGFLAEVYGVEYEDAVKLFSSTDADDTFTEEAWDRACSALHTHMEYMTYLTEQRGLTKDTILEYRLAFTGDGIAYPVFVNGYLCDKRTYRPGMHPKMASERGAEPLLFPFDAWQATKEDYTLLCAGENDCLLARQHGFNAVTVTAGEGRFPRIFAGLFKHKTVYISYDCDKAGKEGAMRVAFCLHEAGAHVRLVDLGLPGTKDSKDITDFFLKEGKTSEDLYHIMQQSPEYSDEDFQRGKNLVYPLVDLWKTSRGEYSGRRISSRVILSGSYDQVMHCPTAIEWKCGGAVKDSDICAVCPLRDKAGWWSLNDKNLKELMELIDVNEKQQDAAIHKFIHMPTKCPNGTWNVRARKDVHKVIFTPDVDTESEDTGYKAVEQYAYTVGLDLRDGERYRIFFRTYAHPLDGQRVFLIVDKAEQSDNSLNSFQLTPEIHEQLKIFQGDPFLQMQDRAERLHGVPGMLFRPYEMVAHVTNIMYHSVLRFKFNGQEMKGYPEALLFGETRTGKTEVALFFQRYVRIGNHVPLKGATTASLLGGAEKTNNGSFKVTWGVVPRNHKGIVLLDELSGMSPEVMGSLTSMRSERKAAVTKIARGTAPAETRLIWTANPRTDARHRSKHIFDYPNGIEILRELIGADEDIARFDFCVLIAKNPDESSSPLDKPEKEAYPSEVYRNLIYWVWSRNSSQIQFSEGVESYIVQVSKEFVDAYDSDVNLLGSETWKKITRIAVSCAGACFSSTPDGDSIVVNKSHVDWAAAFLRRCYDNPVFRLGEYVRERRNNNTTNQAANAIVAGICRTQPMLVKMLINASSPVQLPALQTISGLEGQPFRELISKMTSSFLLRAEPNGVNATRRLRLAVDAYKADYHKSKMVPLSEQ